MIVDRIEEPARWIVSFRPLTVLWFPKHSRNPYVFAQTRRAYGIEIGRCVQRAAWKATVSWGLKERGFGWYPIGFGRDW